MSRESLKQITSFVAIIGVAATTVIVLGLLMLPDATGSGDMADPGSDTFQGAVLTTMGGPVDEGVILARYEMPRGDVATGAAWDAEATFTSGHGESVRFRWSWVDDIAGGETEDVWALFSVREGSFTADEDECQLVIDRYEPYEELTTIEYFDGTGEEFVVWGTEIGGALSCVNVPSRRIGEPISFDAVLTHRTVTGQDVVQD